MAHWNVDPENTKSIHDLSEALGMKIFLVNASGGTISPMEFRALLRCFRWYSHDPKFEDLYDASVAAMPVLGALLPYLAKKGQDYSVQSVSRALEVLAEYLDSASLSLRETEEGTDIVSTMIYSVESDVAKARNLLAINSVVKKKESELHKRASPALKKLLKLSPRKRLENLKARFQEVRTAKNYVYNFVRISGKDLLPVIEQALPDLHPTDQDYLLHGLDAFPKDKSVLAFFDRFLRSTKSEYLKQRVQKYKARVKKGQKTTGYEM
jgi:hypothetical protein